MAVTIKHAKTDNIADWTQTDLDAQIALGNFPAGTVLADIVLPSDWNNDHTISGTVPIANGGTGSSTLAGASIVTYTGTETLTNKTLTSPKVNLINDTNGNEILGFSPTTSATDYFVVKNGIGVGAPIHLYADGSSTNTGMHIQPKGTGLVTISDGTDFSKGIRFRSSSSAASAITLLDAVSTAGRVVTLPDATTTLVGRDTTDTLTNKSISGSTNTLSNIGNSSLTNSAITINGTSTSLGGSISVGTVTSVTGTSPVVSSGGATPAISMPAATTSVNGYLTSTDWNTFNGKGSGTVTSASVVSANGFAGTVANATTTPAITLTTSITGVLKGNGTAISAATSGTDYAPATSGTSILYGNGSGGFSNVTVGSGLSFAAGTLSASGGGGMTYPTGSGIAVVVSGSSWGTTLTAPSGTIVGTTDTQTLSGKTLTGTKETVFTITDGAAFEIDPANGGIQTITLGANRTPKGTNFTAGQSVTLMVNDGTAYTLTWTDTTFGTGGVIWVGGFAPTLAATGYTVIELWKVGSQVYGAIVGSVA